MDTHDKKNNSTDRFVEELIDASNYTDLLPAVREEMKKDLFSRLDDFILARMVAAYSEEDLKKFEHLLDTEASDEEIQAFGPAHIRSEERRVGKECRSRWS